MCTFELLIFSLGRFRRVEELWSQDIHISSITSFKKAITNFQSSIGTRPSSIACGPRVLLIRLYGVSKVMDTVLTPTTCLAGKEMPSRKRWISPSAFMMAVDLLRNRLWPLPTNAPLRTWLMSRSTVVSLRCLVFAAPMLTCNRAQRAAGYGYEIKLGQGKGHTLLCRLWQSCS